MMIQDFALRRGFLAETACALKKVGKVNPANPTLERRKSRRVCCKLSIKKVRKAYSSYRVLIKFISFWPCNYFGMTARANLRVVTKHPKALSFSSVTIHTASS